LIIVSHYLTGVQNGTTLINWKQSFGLPFRSGKK
jgi:hypothetical protein